MVAPDLVRHKAFTGEQIIAPTDAIEAVDDKLHLSIAERPCEPKKEPQCRSDRSSVHCGECRQTIFVTELS